MSIVVDEVERKVIDDALDEWAGYYRDPRAYGVGWHGISTLWLMITFGHVPRGGETCSGPKLDEPSARAQIVEHSVRKMSTLTQLILKEIYIKRNGHAIAAKAAGVSVGTVKRRIEAAQAFIGGAIMAIEDHPKEKQRRKVLGRW